MASDLCVPFGHGAYSAVLSADLTILKMKSVSLKTLTVLCIFVFLLVLRFKLFSDRRVNKSAVVSNQEKEENTELKVDEGNVQKDSDLVVVQEMDKLIEIYNERREYVGQMCREHQSEIEERYSERWPDRNWDTFVAKADVLEKSDQGFLWCKVPKAASESWTSLFIERW